MLKNVCNTELQSFNMYSGQTIELVHSDYHDEIF